MVKGMFVISQEMTKFAQTRLKEDAKNCEALSHCHNPSEALNCQQRFAEAATAVYPRRSQAPAAAENVRSLSSARDRRGLAPA